MPRPLDYLISKDFRSVEFCVSSSHPELVEDVPGELRPNLHALVLLGLQPLRDMTGAMKILSGYRSTALNDAVKGSPTSQHMLAEAADVVCKTHSPQALFDLIRLYAKRFAFGQVILYDSFVHVASPSARFPKPTFFEHTAGGARRIV